MSSTPHGPPSGPQGRGPEQRVAGIPRGPGSELRLSLSEYEGHPFLDLRLWECHPAGGWRPTTKGTSIRIREIEGVIDALRQALAIVQGDPRADVSGPPFEPGYGQRARG